MNATATTNESAASDNIVTRRLNLADPADYPEADVVIFDGDCQFCQKQVLRLSRYDNNQHRLSFISLHDPRVAERYPDLTHQQLMDEMYVVTHSGQRYAGAEAVRYLSRRLPLLWIMAPLLHIPFFNATLEMDVQTGRRATVSLEQTSRRTGMRRRLRNPS